MAKLYALNKCKILRNREKQANQPRAGLGGERVGTLDTPTNATDVEESNKRLLSPAKRSETGRPITPELDNATAIKYKRETMVTFNHIIKARGGA